MQEEVVNLEVSPLGFPVKGRFRYQNRVFFKLPFSLTPTVSDGQSSFEVVYYLKVFLYTHGTPKLVCRSHFFSQSHICRAFIPFLYNNKEV
jgi:hypothetical protein